MATRRTPAHASPAPDAPAQLEAFIAKYSPEVARTARAAYAALRKRLPAATVLVYDSYNALAIGFGPGERPKQIIFSLALYPRWVSLFFTQGAALADPQRRLQGKGGVMRHLVLDNAATLDELAVRSLIRGALERAGTRLRGKSRGAVIIKSVSARQRPRRPAAARQKRGVEER